MIHHIAILTPNVEKMAAFYMALLDAPKVQEHHDAAGLRAMWLQMGTALLMIERSEIQESGRHVLMFQAEAGSYAQLNMRLKALQAGPTDRSTFSIYGRDPDGHRIGFSAYPYGLDAPNG